MNIGEWKAKLIEQPGVYGAVLYLWRLTSTREREFLIKNGEIRTCAPNSGPPSEDLSFAVLEPEQLQAMADAFSNFGVKTPNDHKLQGLLQAKDEHLKDMRALVFKGKRPL